MYLIRRYLLSSKQRILWHTNLVKISCWSCGKEVQSLISNLFCSHCKVLQKPNQKDNYFKIMGIEENYDIDDTYLAKKYKELQKHLHPDKYSNK